VGYLTGHVLLQAISMCTDKVADISQIQFSVEEKLSTVMPKCNVNTYYAFKKSIRQQNKT
jgi:hypothetical protein